MEAKNDKFFITEIINDLHRNGFIEGGKAATVLHDWSAELREKARVYMSASRLRRTFNDEVGTSNW
jgi:hypothetical protein